MCGVWLPSEVETSRLSSHISSVLSDSKSEKKTKKTVPTKMLTHLTGDK